jgi:hypothetical protein
MEEVTTVVAGEDLVGTTSTSLLYFANMKSGRQYQITFADYVFLQGRLAKDELNGIHVVKPNTPDELVIVIRNIETLSVEKPEPEVYDG